MKERLMCFVMCLSLSVPSVAIAKPKREQPKQEQKNAMPAAHVPMPPGLQKQDKQPPGLEKRGKTPRGWRRGKARWKSSAPAASGDAAMPSAPHEGHGHSKHH